MSIDHFHLSLPGRWLDTHGKEHINKNFLGGAIFVDHATGFMDIQFQTSLNLHHTINSKNAFKDKCADWGVVMQSHLMDNGTSFCHADFDAKLKAFHQHIMHSSARAHHSNGLAE